MLEGARLENEVESLTLNTRDLAEVSCEKGSMLALLRSCGITHVQ